MKFRCVPVGDLNEGSDELACKGSEFLTRLFKALSNRRDTVAGIVCDVRDILEFQGQSVDHWLELGVQNDVAMELANATKSPGRCVTDNFRDIVDKICNRGNGLINISIRWMLGLPKDQQSM